MSRRKVLQGTIGVVIVVCGLFFSLSYVGTTHAATRTSAVPQLCGGTIEWDYVTSDTKRQTYTINNVKYGKSYLTLQVHVELQAEFGDNGYCGFMRSELTVSEVSCTGSPVCYVYSDPALTYFVTTGGNKINSSPNYQCVGDCGEIDITTNPVPATAGAAGGYLAV